MLTLEGASLAPLFNTSMEVELHQTSPISPEEPSATESARRLVGRKHKHLIISESLDVLIFARTDLLFKCYAFFSNARVSSSELTLILFFIIIKRFLSLLP